MINYFTMQPIGSMIIAVILHCMICTLTHNPLYHLSTSFDYSDHLVQISKDMFIPLTCYVGIGEITYRITLFC